MPKDDAKLNLDFDDLARDRFLFGSPDEVTEQIVRFNKTLGANHFSLGNDAFPFIFVSAGPDDERECALLAVTKVEQSSVSRYEKHFTLKRLC